jgi:hypothetical protein
MAQFIFVEGEHEEGNPVQAAINLEQVCQVVISGPRDSLEFVRVFTSDGLKLTLRGQAALDFFDVLTQPRYAATLPTSS